VEEKRGRRLLDLAILAREKNIAAEEEKEKRASHSCGP